MEFELPRELPRQPMPVTIILAGEPSDIAHYLTRIKRLIEVSGYDNVEYSSPNTLTIYPAAVND